MARIIQFEMNKYFNLDTQSLFIDGVEVGKPIEGIPFKILTLLATNYNVRFSADTIHDRCWEEGKEGGDVAYHINKLRNLIKDVKIPGTQQYTYIKCFDSKYYCPFKIQDNYDITSNTDVRKTSRNLTLKSFFNISENSVLFRDKEIHDVIDAIMESGNLVLSGDGGVGKTSVARRVFSLLRENFDYYGWINYNERIDINMLSDINVDIDGYSDVTMSEVDIKKRWNSILTWLANDKATKLFVIDNCDDIDNDENLSYLSGLPNVKFIITSRLAEIPGFDNVINIGCLGNKNDSSKCVDLFYHYNDAAEKYRETNIKIVSELCEIACYNTMAIELLAKASKKYYYDKLELFQKKLEKIGFKFADEELFTTNRTREKKTAVEHLLDLFTLKKRNEVEQKILWDFHCLPDSEMVSKEELQEWFGYSFREISKLEGEGWIKTEAGLYYIHPLVKQAVSCNESKWIDYWDTENQIREMHPSIINQILNHSLFADEDNFTLKIRKLRFADYLSYEGRFLNSRELIYIADNARVYGVRDMGLKYYKLAYDRLKEKVCENELCSKALLLPESHGKKLLLRACCGANPFILPKPYSEGIELLRHFWRTCYFYGYMLSYTTSGLEDAEEYISLSMIIIRRLEEFLEEDTFLNWYGRTADHLAYVISRVHIYDLNFISMAYSFYSEALECRERLALDYPINKEYQRNLAWTMDNLGVFLTDFITDEEYIKHREEFYYDSDYFEGGEKHPAVKRNRDLLKSRMSDAENLLKKSLEIRKSLAEANGDKYSTEVAWTDVSITRLLLNFKDRWQEAEKYILDAIHIYNELDKLYPTQHASSQAKAYRIYGSLLNNEEKKAEAQKAMEISLGIYEKLNQEYPNVYLQEVDITKAQLERIKK